MAFRTHTLMLCMLQVRDGARRTQSTPTNMGRFGRGDGPSWVVRRVGWSWGEERVSRWQAVVKRGGYRARMHDYTQTRI